jgi:hypothetical protein
MATAMAGIAAAVALLGVEMHVLGPDPVEHFFFWGTAAVASFATIVIGFLPILIAVVVAEAYAVRSLLIYAFAGAAIFLLGYYSAGFTSAYEESIDYPPPPISRQAEIAAAVGVVFGFTYWLIAGRNSRRWRGR